MWVLDFVELDLTRYGENELPHRQGIDQAAAAPARNEADATRPGHVPIS